MKICKGLASFFVKLGVGIGLTNFSVKGMEKLVVEEGDRDRKGINLSLLHPFNSEKACLGNAKEESILNQLERISFSSEASQSISEKLRLAREAEEKEQDEEAIKHYNEAVGIKKISKTQKARIYYGRAGFYKNQALKQQGERKKILLDQAYQDYHVTLLHLEMAETRSPTLPSIGIIENEMRLISSLKSAE